MRRPSFALLSVVMLWTSPSAAQKPDPQRASAAQVLFDQAVDEMGKKQFDSACPKLEEATRLVPDALGAKEQLALCYEGSGRLASAWSQWVILQGLAEKAGAGQAKRQKTAAEHASALRPRLAALTIDVADETASLPGVLVKRDDVEIGSPQWGTEVPVDKGSHDVLVTAPGYQPFRKQVEILTDGARASVRIPPLVREADTGSEKPPPVERVTWPKPVGFAALGVGAAGLAVGAVFGGLAIAKNDESNVSGCDENNLCTIEGTALRNDARTMGNVSTAAFVAGGVLAAAGITLLIVAPGGAKDEKSGVTLDVRATPGGLLWTGRF